jgi:sulfonate transport system permease protein
VLVAVRDAEQRGTPAARSSPSRVHRGRWARWISPVGLLVVWQVLSGTGLVPSQKLPPLQIVWRAAVEVAGNGQLGDGLVVSLRRMLIGFVIGALLGSVCSPDWPAGATRSSTLSCNWCATCRCSG